MKNDNTLLQQLIASGDAIPTNDPDVFDIKDETAIRKLFGPNLLNMTPEELAQHEQQKINNK